MSEIDYQKLLKDALIEMRKMRSQLDRVEQEKHEPIAVIGMDCRFPGGADNPDLYWEMLKNGVDGIVEVPPNRWDIDEYYDANPDTSGKMYARYGGFIEDVDKFDPQFFGISPREAKAIDPQQRLLLEVTHNALENAGQSTTKLKGSKTGVFVGQCFDDYSRRSINSGDPTRIDAFNSLGNTSSITAGRIAYILGLQGTTLQLDTTCSSSLVAVHLACQSLRNKELNLAIAGGVNLMLSPEVTIGFCRLKALSADGHCKTFDASADGYVRGEGCGVVILKRLSDAIADNDNILAVIKGSAVNHDGQSNGLTAPNGNAQEAVISEALNNAKVKPEDVSYIEAHGTGTSLGDPIEVLALGKVFTSNRENKLKIGSVKTNFGHLESAAGVAGLIKVILSIQHKAIPPHLNYHEPNPYIPWDKLSIEVGDRFDEWNNETRIAGVSSFGMSGTNAHLVVMEAALKDTASHKGREQRGQREQGEQGEQRAGGAEERRLELLTLSAKSEAALKDLVKQYQSYLSSPASISLRDICYTSSVGRSHFQHRLAITAQSIDELQQKLTALKDTALHRANRESPLPNNKIAFLFTGQGSQYVGMGQELYETEPVFREHCDRCFQLLQPYLDTPLQNIIFSSSASSTSPASSALPALINQTQYTQPALFTIEYALAQLWMSWGIKPTAVMGHSIGEYVAATIAGVFSLEDALKLVTARGRLMQQLPQNGSMVSILGDLKLVSKLIKPYQGKTSIAAINGDKSIVVSGENNAIICIIEYLEKDGIKHKQLNVSHAFHSDLMQPMLNEFGLVAEEINYYAPELDIVSNITGNIVDLEIATAEYWCQQIISPVLFADGIKALKDAGYKVFLECGSKPILLGMARFCLEEEPGREELVGAKGFRPKENDYAWVISLKKNSSDRQTMLDSVSSLYSSGVEIDWDSFYRHGDYQRVILPTYPFQKKSYWLDVKPLNISQINNSKINLLLGSKLNIARSSNITFETRVNLNRPVFLQDHKVFDTAIMPAAGYVEMAISAGKEVFGFSQLVLNNFNIQQPLITTASDTIVQFILTPEANNYTFEIVSLADHSN
ncbi:MAG: type I polyketide synthase, partial [Cyanobacteria bacterium J06600_6]